ncbi:RagB/SusD family nutrient uptake outer membrane protein [Yeosuana marina]|uniref:RagB/SusD family nutrient uptake outer membrane protein n=1 Tax=Yeosuana marina TaxID=1565536 RepID=UPI0014214FB4|nr:RagB/SusD family nutrient uptake outer membrane protein [Yeosuana marina]
MKIIESNKQINIAECYFNGSIRRPIKYLLYFILIFFMSSCTDFIEVDPPKNVLISKTVFEDSSTVESALANIYYKMREQGMISGRYGLSSMMGIYSDELNYYGFDTNYIEIYTHHVSPSNAVVLAWWSHAYNLIYAANDIISGVETSVNLSQKQKEEFKGQALFVRGYMHSLLVNLFGSIPYITTTNYVENNKVTRIPVNKVYENIISDLEAAATFMGTSDDTGEHVVVNASVAKALLARTYLYTEQWELAEAMADDLITNYSLELDINSVFLKESSETIWQFKPNGVSYANTYEANQFVIRFIPGQTYALSDSMIGAFESGDLRLSYWTGSATSNDGLTTLYYPYKYKALLSETDSLEYSIIFRLTEQYLIRAESRTHLGNIIGAQEDLNMIRNRAGLDNTEANNKNNLLDAILHERQVEFFTEHGHRWFDLKRMGVANEILSPIKPNWKDSNFLLPIPETELEINPNLKPQNSGY